MRLIPEVDLAFAVRVANHWLFEASTLCFSLNYAAPRHESRDSIRPTLLKKQAPRLVKMATEVATANAGDRMLETAIRLFKQKGIQATGVEQIIAESGSARGTLYSHFGSKSGLIAAALEAEGQQWRDWFFKELKASSESPRDQLLAMFDVMASWFGEAGYTGCLFMNAIAECRSQDDEVRAATMRHKRLVNNRIRQLAKKAGSHDPAGLTCQLDLLLDGLIITALVTKSTKLVAQGKGAAETLIASSLGE